jgi:hypothetical protein
VISKFLRPGSYSLPKSGQPEISCGGREEVRNGFQIEDSKSN